MHVDVFKPVSQIMTIDEIKPVQFMLLLDDVSLFFITVIFDLLKNTVVFTFFVYMNIW